MSKLKLIGFQKRDYQKAQFINYLRDKLKGQVEELLASSTEIDVKDNLIEENLNNIIEALINECEIYYSKHSKSGADKLDTIVKVLSFYKINRKTIVNSVEYILKNKVLFSNILNYKKLFLLRKRKQLLNDVALFLEKKLLVK